MRTLKALARPQVSQFRFALELTTVVAIKAALLYWAWSAWFSHPLAPHMRMSPALVQQQILGAPAANFASAPFAASDLSSGENHDSRR
ncbi:cytochrome oxidase putative small subunit CydP [Amantichitinum ursilacus]|uniref:Uncharacterized protein n=1 Tax=Amantichitinum ursilacus TaxID=857265 RepID=A0A0N0GQI5_9NEIS|nr:cytochrome oxidase putative small subunit CydP [Amantichitinum ursilacus]KPC54680.1 hypothetical protein WG78_03875 [Amantichitinum ursilacus]